MKEIIKHKFLEVLYVTLLLFSSISLSARNNNEIMNIDTGIYITYEQHTKQTIEEVVNSTFTRLKDGVINLGIHKGGIWFRFYVKNPFDKEQLYLKIGQPVLDRISLYYLDSTGGQYLVKELGENMPYYSRIINSPNYIIPVSIKPGKVKEFYLRIETSDQIQIPLTIATAKGIFHDEMESTLIFGLYLGIIVVMILYHLMIYSTVKDKSYPYYILFIIGVGLTQFTLRGYGFQYFWPGSPEIQKYSTIIVPFISGITTAAFMKQFLHTKTLVPRWDTGINIFIGFYCLSLILGLLVEISWGLRFLQITAFSGALYSLILGFVLLKKNFRPAKFFMIAYSVFLLAVIIFVLCNFNLLPYNRFTSYILEQGSAIQIILLSLALADKINIYKNEQNLARQEALRISIENTRLIQEQNILLEEEVKNRTQELRQTNSELEQAMVTLKNTQAQLINAEKMSSLGQLTAGIAHEINNPINFVTANIKPLQLDIQDLKSIIHKYEQIDLNGNLADQIAEVEKYKKQLDISYVQNEIDTLLAGINEGAKRTAEIVKELKNFVRLDEDQMKATDLEKGLDSTLLILKNKIPFEMELMREKGNIPMVECMPGKINQVFMNIIVNAIDAIKMNKNRSEKGKLHIKTWADDQMVHISIKDNGIGMNETVLKNIFDPFFTTKDVGEGTGLGLSITQSIIKHHSGNIKVQSKMGEGSEFIIILPIIHN